jgi:hypothetical protein
MNYSSKLNLIVKMMEKITLRIQSICRVPRILLGSILVLGFIVSIPAEAAARFKLLQSLGYSVGSPSGKLTTDSAGNLYGATSTGGGSNAGTVSSSIRPEPLASCTSSTVAWAARILMPV